jgi:phosphoglycolate phosphatase-like HAD superfamily hydrolase
MKTLILPIAGKSSRFPDMRPKWLLTLPNGKIMLEWSIDKVNIESFSRVVVVVLREHIDKYVGRNEFNKILQGIHHNISVVELDEPTSSQSETVFRAIQQAEIKGAILIKDCDNQFRMNYIDGNIVAVANLNDFKKINAGNKSYVSIDGLGEIKNIAEKSVISKYFCCGAYGFEKAEDFAEIFTSIKHEGEVYISHIIYAMIMRNHSFRVCDVSGYVDIGTLEDYREYVEAYKTVFCDLDGVLFINGSKFTENGWKTSVIDGNVEVLKRLQEQARLHLVITTSRPASEIEYIKAELHKKGLHPQQIITDLPHSKRYLINDYGTTNRYPSAVAINIRRNETSLKDFL